MKTENQKQDAEEVYLNQLIDEANKEFSLDRKLAKKVALKFAKWQQEKMYSEEDMIMFADFFYNYKELLKREKWEILEMSKEDIFKKWIEKVKKK